MAKMNHYSHKCFQKGKKKKEGVFGGTLSSV